MPKELIENLQELERKLDDRIGKYSDVVQRLDQQRKIIASIIDPDSEVIPILDASIDSVRKSIEDVQEAYNEIERYIDFIGGGSLGKGSGFGDILKSNLGFWDDNSKDLLGRFRKKKYKGESPATNVELQDLGARTERAKEAESVRKNRQAAAISAVAGITVAGVALALGGLGAVPAAYAIGKVVKDVAKPAWKAHMRAKEKYEKSKGRIGLGTKVKLHFGEISSDYPNLGAELLEGVGGLAFTALGLAFVPSIPAMKPIMEVGKKSVKVIAKGMTLFGDSDQATASDSGDVQSAIRNACKAMHRSSKQKDRDKREKGKPKKGKPKEEGRGDTESKKEKPSEDSYSKFERQHDYFGKTKDGLKFAASAVGFAYSVLDVFDGFAPEALMNTLKFVSGFPSGPLAEALEPLISKGLSFDAGTFGENLAAIEDVASEAIKDAIEDIADGAVDYVESVTESFMRPNTRARRKVESTRKRVRRKAEPFLNRSG